MPVRCTFHSDLDLVVVSFSGVVQDPEFIAFYRDMYAHADFVVGMDEIANLRDVEEFRISTSALMRVKQIVTRRYEGSGKTFRTAIVAPADAAYGVSRIYDALVSDSPEEASVFRDLESAIEWLGLAKAPPDIRAEPDGDAGVE